MKFGPPLWRWLQVARKDSSGSRICGLLTMPAYPPEIGYPKHEMAYETMWRFVRRYKVLACDGQLLFREVYARYGARPPRDRLYAPYGFGLLIATENAMTMGKQIACMAMPASSKGRFNEDECFGVKYLPKKVGKVCDRRDAWLAQKNTQKKLKTVDPKFRMAMILSIELGAYL